MARIELTAAAVILQRRSPACRTTPTSLQRPSPRRRHATYNLLHTSYYLLLTTYYLLLTTFYLLLATYLQLTNFYLPLATSEAAAEAVGAVSM